MKSFEDRLVSEVACIFTVMHTKVFRGQDYDEKIRKIKIGLRSGKGQEYLDILKNIIDNSKSLDPFHPIYVNGTYRALKQALHHGVFDGADSIPHVNHSQDNVNVFEQPDGQYALNILSTWTKSTLPYYYVMKYGIARLENDLRKFYPKAKVYLKKVDPDFVREPASCHGIKYNLYHPMMPIVVLWNGKQGIRNL